MASAGEAVGEDGAPPPTSTTFMVTFPNAARERSLGFLNSSLKLEDVVEESGPAADSSTPPRNNMWQVYAVCGFMVSSWIWARLKERKERGDPAED
ncbi:uncharacterized protein M6B38_286635 [Iris pallida]|uniref:Uncharacterized protein n=1 Tax=Iris pallida TaxID=29817 RepID=A0AAX6HZP2_IRIPA|nr:uncharacterized protein M6B38_395205 [Iris pallida]KAJ6845685.1 uncharacterized protein M6B38_286635 [Iris pallida]